MRRSYDERRRLVVDGFTAIPGVRVPVPRGAFYAFPDVGALTASGDAWPLVERWLDRGVAVLPGAAFAAPHAGHVRVSLATKLEDLEEALRRLQG
jgi:aspartate aminotransferase